MGVGIEMLGCVSMAYCMNLVKHNAERCFRTSADHAYDANNLTKIQCR